jgi:rhodanese-related sulfurtransferase
MSQSNCQFAQLPLLVVGALALSLAPLAIADGDAAGEAEPVPQSLLLEYLADDSRFTLVDARSPGEFNESHITGAVNVPVDSVDELINSLPEDPDEMIVVYCKTGKRARQLQSKLEDRGFTDVRVLQSDQIVWFDGMAVFNCATPPSRESAGNATARLVDGLSKESK